MSRFEYMTLRRLPAILALALAVSAPLAAWSHEHAHGDQPYALVRAGGQGMSISGDGADWSAIKQARGHVQGDFLWFRENGRAWVIQDPDTLAKARAAWREVDRLGQQMDAYGRDMDAQAKAMGALGKEMGELGSQMGAAAQPAGQRQAEMEMKQISLRMDETKAPMDALGRKMDALGKDMDRATNAADQAVHALIRDAKARGLARPAP